MRIKTFKVERWMNDFEDDAVYNLGETCIDSLTIEQLLEIGGYNPAEYLAELAKTRLFDHFCDMFLIWFCVIIGVSFVLCGIHQLGI